MLGIPLMCSAMQPTDSNNSFTAEIITFTVYYSTTLSIVEAQNTQFRVIKYTNRWINNLEITWNERVIEKFGTLWHSSPGDVEKRNLTKNMWCPCPDYEWAPGECYELSQVALSSWDSAWMSPIYKKCRWHSGAR